MRIHDEQRNELPPRTLNPSAAFIKRGAQLSAKLIVRSLEILTVHRKREGMNIPFDWKRVMNNLLNTSNHLDGLPQRLSGK